MDNAVQETEFCTFWTSHLRSQDHLAALLGFRSWVLGVLNDSETMLSGVCFAFPMSIHSDVEFPVHNAWIWARFDHLEGPLGITPSVHRAFDNTETVLFGVFCFLDVYSYGSRVFHDLDIRQHYSARGTAVHILYVAMLLRWNCYLWIMCDFCHTWVTEQPILVRGPLCTETHITPKFIICLSFSNSMGKRPRSVTWLSP